MQMWTRTVAQGLLRPINPYSPVLLGIFTLFWGLWLISPFWDTYTRADVFQYLAGVAPEWAWGSWSVVSGILVVYYTAHQRYLALMRSLGFVLWHWGSVAWLMWWGDWQNTAGLTYSGVTLYAMFLFLNVRINYARRISNWHLRRYFNRIRSWLVKIWH